MTHLPATYTDFSPKWEIRFHDVPVGVGKDTSVPQKNHCFMIPSGTILGPLTSYQLEAKARLCSFVLFIPVSNRELHQPTFVWQSHHTVIKNTFLFLSLTLLSIKLFHILLFTLSFSIGFTCVHVTYNFICVSLLTLVSWLFMQYLG